jgi:hypothetical protein
MKNNIVSRQRRVEAYAKMEGPSGACRDQKTLDYWADRAAKNSEIAPMASDGPMKLPSTKVKTRDTSMKPYAARNAREVAKSDRNHDAHDSPFMKSVRRGQS